VLRHRTGDSVEFVDGTGGWYRAVIREARPREVLVDVVEKRAGVGEPSYDLTLCAAIPKNRNRLEMLIEKSTELGVACVVPMMTERTERSRLNVDRLDRVAVAAMKQCGRSRLPSVEKPTEFAHLIRGTDCSRSFLCHLGDGSELAGPYRTLRSAIEPGTKELRVFVGPEGGFTAEEVRLAASAGTNIVTLGHRRLRTETAGIMAAAIISSILGDSLPT
jgi:16S rRNA (uracil1498-N3)-methyltransferase